MESSVKHIVTQKKESCLNLELFDSRIAVGKYQMPFIHKEDIIPSGIIDFCRAISSRDYLRGVHFYLDDYRFERIWKNPFRYIPILKKYHCVFTPDFSIFYDMPMPMKIWNVYRSRLLGQIMQQSGIRVIPTVSWADSPTFEFCFDGIEPGGTISLSSVGIGKDTLQKKRYEAGFLAMIEKISPRTIIEYGDRHIDISDNIEHIFFKNTTFEWKNKQNNINYKG